MFKLFKRDPRKPLQQAYEAKLKQAMESQRNGDIRRYSELTAEADELYRRLLVLDAESLR